MELFNYIKKEFGFLDIKLYVQKAKLLSSKGSFSIAIDAKLNLLEQSFTLPNPTLMLRTSKFIFVKIVGQVPLQFHMQVILY